MQVILKEDYVSLGFVGDTVTVKPGFARNFLFPRKIALPLTSANANLLAHQKKLIEVKKAEKREEALKYKERLEGVVVTLQHAAAEEKLFGSVSSAEICQFLATQGFTVDRKLVKIDAPIKRVGTHTVGLRLHQDVTALIKVVVEAPAEAKKLSEDENAETAPRKAKRSPRKKEAKAEEEAEEKTEVKKEAKVKTAKKGKSEATSGKKSSEKTPQDD